MKSLYSRFASSLVVVTLPALVFFSNQSSAAIVNASATGAWDAGATWSDTLPAAAGNDYTIDGFTVSSPTTSNTVTFPGDSITISKTGATAGVLDLARLHANTEQIISTTLPAVTVNTGATLQFRASTGSNRWNLGSAPIAVSGTVLFNNTGGSYAQNINLSGPLSGSGLIEYKTANSGSSTTERTLTLNSADSTYSGNWFVQHANTGNDYGTLAAGAANALGTGTVTLDTRANLRNNATNGFDSLTGITASQSTSNIYFNGRDWTSPTAVLTMTNGTANVGSAHLTIASLSQAAGTINLIVGGSKYGKLITSGNADFTGGLIAVSYGGSPVGKTFDLVTYGGTLVTPPTVSTGDLGRLTPTVNNGSGSNDKVTLSVSGTVADLIWTGATNDNWDNNATMNFTNGGPADVFRSFDNVLFEDTPDFNNPLLVGNLTAGTVTFNNSLKNYTLAGTGSLAGPAALVKSGTGSLTISNTTASTFSGGISISGGTVNITTAQNYTGNINITGGKLVLGNASAIGATGSRTVSVTGGGQFDFSGFSPGTSHTHTYRISGDGGGTGALINSSTTSVGANSGIQNLELLGNATIGGAGRFDIARVGTTSGTITGNSHTLTKTGANQINLRGAASDLTIIVNEGILGLEDSDLAFGGASGNVTVNDTAVLGVWGARTIATPVTLNAGSTLRALGGGAANWTGPITLSGASTVDLSGQAKTISGNITGTGSFSKTGGNALTLSGNSDYSGGTTITLGQVNVTSNTAFGTGTVTFQHTTSSTTITRANLTDVTIANDFVLNTNAQTGFRGPINTSAGNTLSTLSGTITIQSGVGNGGHFSSTDGGVLRLTGTLNTTGPLPNIRSGTVEMGTTGGNLTQLSQGEGTLRLVATNGIQSTLRLNLAVSGGGTLDLNGFNQTLAELRRHTTHAATVTNNAATPSVLTIDGTVNHDFTGAINDGTGVVAVTKTGTSVWTLTGTNAYSGATDINGGTLRVNGSIGSGAVTVAANGTLGGTGIVNGAITVNGTLAPGASAGELTTNEMTFGGGSALEWEVDDWTGAAGTGWDLLDATDITFNNTPASKLTVRISGTAANFTETNKTFTIATAVGTINGFNAAAIEIDDSAFTGSGTWAIQPNGNTIELVYTAGAANTYATWAATYAGNQSADLDFDLDGVSNGVEYFMGITTPGFTANPPIINGKVTWPMSPSFTGTYVVKTSDNLVNWTPAVSGLVVTPGVSVEYTLPTGDPKRFARIEVTVP